MFFRVSKKMKKVHGKLWSFQMAATMMANNCIKIVKLVKVLVIKKEWLYVWWSNSHVR